MIFKGKKKKKKKGNVHRNNKAASCLKQRKQSGRAKLTPVKHPPQKNLSFQYRN